MAEFESLTNTKFRDCCNYCVNYSWSKFLTVIVSSIKSQVSGVVGSEKLYFGGRIRYYIGGASPQVASDNVHNSARLIRTKNCSIPNVNMTFGVSSHSTPFI
ncbi:hypothetical protein Lal_00035107 [Lupinus albus]|nr:hypothetical protein Lal_00035107 [Lupinus albus]